MPGIESLNSKEEEIIEEFQMRMKTAVTPVMREDPTLFYRFLKARDFDIDKAEKMLRKNIIWRKGMQADTILEDFKPKEFFVKYPEPSLVGFEKDGTIAAYSPLGKFNVHDVFKSMKMYDLMKHFTWFAEKYVRALKENNEKIGKNAYQGTLIADLDELTLGNATANLSVTALLRFLHMYQDNYPERMKNLYLINAPSYYIFVYSVLKTVMSGATIRKIHVFGRSGWKEKLLEVIDADVLPAFLGGNRTDPDGNPLCKTFITFGGAISEHYFLSDEERYFKDKKRVETVVVPSSEKKEVYVYAKEAGYILEWEFFAKGKDIEFGVFFQASVIERDEIIPVQRYDTSEGTIRDVYKCRSAGTYIIIFDNSFSWFSSKEVQYCITIRKPEQRTT